MSSDASTLPPAGTPLPGRAAEALPRPWRERAKSSAHAVDGARVGAVALLAIVACSALLVLAAADRPSLLSATTHAGYYPHWMAGPLGGIWSGLTRNSTTLKNLFSGSIALMYVGYLVVLGCARRIPARWVIAAIVAVHVIFLLSPPLSLTDVFNYVNYGRMEVVHHLNPYTTIPVFEPHSDPSYDLSNWHELLSPYGPLFTLMTFAIVPLGVAASLWFIKVVLGLASLATIFLVWKCARLLGRDPVAAIALVGLNPIVLVWGLGGDHNDFLMVFFIVLGFYLLLLCHARTAARSDAPTTVPGAVPTAGTDGGHARERGARPRSLDLLAFAAGGAFVTAVAIKASGGVLIPIVLAGLLRTPRRLIGVVAGMVAATALVALASVIAFGLHVPELSAQSRLVTNLSLPNLVGLAAGAGGETPFLREVFAVVLLASVLLCAAAAWRARDSLTASGWATVALLATLGWELPWYVLWMLPLAALSSSRRLRAVALVFGVYVIIAWAPSSARLWDAIGFHPERTSLGRLHERYVRELLD